MKKSFNLFCFLLMFIVASIFLYAEDPTKINLVISEWEPYTSGDLPGNGILTELTVAALSKAGYESDVTLLPWPRGVDYVKSGRFDALIGASYTVERLDYFSFPDVLWVSYISFFSQAGKNIQYTTLENLVPSKIGVINGSFLFDILSPIDGLIIETEATVEQNIRKLAAERVDYIMDSDDSVQYMLITKLQELGNKIERIDPPFKKDDLYVVFSKRLNNYEKLTSDFNRGLEMIKADGTYQEIVEKHGLALTE